VADHFGGREHARDHFARVPRPFELRTVAKARRSSPVLTVQEPLPRVGGIWDARDLLLLSGVEVLAVPVPEYLPKGFR